MEPQHGDKEFKALEFDSTLGYPGEGPPRVPDFGAMDKCVSAISFHGEYHVEEMRVSARDAKM